MDKRDRLFKMLVEANYMVAGDVVPRSPDERLYAIVDYLFAHGVEIPPCKVGDTVWVFNQLKGCIYENKVHGIYLTGTGDCKNTVRLEYTNQFGEKSYRKYSFSQFGKNVFLSHEEAEQRKFEYLKRLQ